MIQQKTGFTCTDGGRSVALYRSQSYAYAPTQYCDTGPHDIGLLEQVMVLMVYPIQNHIPRHHQDIPPNSKIVNCWITKGSEIQDHTWRRREKRKGGKEEKRGKRRRRGARTDFNYSVVDPSSYLCLQYIHCGPLQTYSFTQQPR